MCKLDYTEQFSNAICKPKLCNAKPQNGLKDRFFYTFTDTYADDVITVRPN